MLQVRFMSTVTKTLDTPTSRPSAPPAHHEGPAQRWAALKIAEDSRHEDGSCDEGRS
jgi:hypothetical protein